MTERVITAEEKAQMMGFNPDLAPKETVTAPVTEPKTETDDPVFDLGMFNKKFGKEFDSEEAITSLFEKAGKYDEVQANHEALSEKLTKYERDLEKLDPISNFLNTDEYIRQQFLIKNRERLEEEAIQQLVSLSPKKIKELSPVESLKIDLMVNEGLTSEEATAYLSDKYNTEDFEEMDAASKAKMKLDVKSAKSRLDKLYEGIEIPQKIDHETARTQLKESWKNPVNELVKTLDKIPVAEGVDFVVTEEMKEGLLEETLAEIANSGLKPSEDTLRQIKGHLTDRLILHNMDKFVKGVMTDAMEKAKAELRKQVHNDKPLSTATRVSEDTMDNDSKIKSML